MTKLMDKVADRIMGNFRVTLRDVFNQYKTIYKALLCAQTIGVPQVFYSDQLPEPRLDANHAIVSLTSSLPS